MEELINEIKKEEYGKVLTDVSLREYTTYKVGGNCRIMVFPRNIEKLVQLIRKLKKKKVTYMVLGKGSNVLFSDQEYKGVIIKLDCLDHIEWRGNKLIVGAGVSLMKVAMMSVRKGLSGLEFATGIPGSVGGAVYMNAGAYKSDMGYVVSSVKVLTPNLRVITMVNKELQFHYRTSFFKTHPGYICLEATIKLKPGKKEEIEELVQERKKRRLETQPLEYPSAGSVFRNPEGLFAGKLIEDLGYKGLSKGGAMISAKHANFIVNYQEAKAKDIKDLIDFIQEEVREKYQIELKVEQEFKNWE
ncbi:MAG: UDP-N-acetylmuramate dehydrogenase [Bacilli bacterium]|nr:UDP-N-acetylmuramate dehydrogenase [Bacilli bacterium]